MHTPRLQVVDWTDPLPPPANLNWLVRSAERLNLVSARVPSRFKRFLPLRNHKSSYRPIGFLRRFRPVTVRITKHYLKRSDHKLLPSLYLWFRFPELCLQPSEESLSRFGGNSYVSQAFKTSVGLVLWSYKTYSPTFWRFFLICGWLPANNLDGFKSL